MAESWGTQGQWCDVATFDRRAASGQVLQAWKDYCDCMFLERVELHEFLCDGSPIPQFIVQPSPLHDQSIEAKARRAADYCKLKSGAYSVRVRIIARETEEWRKCLSNFCTLPDGCPNPVIPSVIMPFNVSPAAGLAPWTELGAAARGIKKRDAGFLYTLGQVFTISLKDYEPLNLWKNYFTNPVMFSYLAWKLNIIPGIGSSIATLLNATPFSIIALAPLAAAQCGLEGRDVWNAMVIPAVTGGVKNAVFALQALGPFLGQQYFALAGLVVEKFAKDQIESGEIDKVLDPLSNGVIRFFAASGADIGRQLQNVLTEGLDLKSADGIMRVFERGFRAVADSPQMTDKLAKAVLNTTADVFAIIALIAEGFRKYANLPIVDKMWAIADDVVYQLFGFRLTELKRAALTSAAEVQQLLIDAKRKGKAGTIDGLMQMLEAIGNAFNKVVVTLDDIGKQMDGALDKFNEQFVGFNQVLNAVRTDTATAFQAAAGGQAAVLTSATNPATGPLLGGTQKDSPSTSPPASDSRSLPGAKQSSSSAGALLIGAAGGFAVAGPVGAAGGAALALALSSKPPIQYALTPTKVREVIAEQVKQPTTTVKQTTTIGPRFTFAGFDYTMDTRTRAPTTETTLPSSTNIDLTAPYVPPDYMAVRLDTGLAPAPAPAPSPVPVAATPPPVPVAVAPVATTPRPDVWQPGRPAVVKDTGQTFPEEPGTYAPPPVPEIQPKKGGFNLWWLVVLAGAYKFAQAKSTVATI